ncbi:MAG: N-acetyltransferase [Opitutales bacterium]|nr:N-acetyltransferase [Opitutales bacterium]MDG2166578.1 N-acetyltransferase [Opitutales bacterium]
MVRRALKEDFASAQEILDLAFAPSPCESTLVECVYRSTEVFHDWVYLESDRIVAYVLYTQACRRDELVGWHLAPLAVHPDFQNKGLGSELIEQTLLESPISDEPVFVLGDPNYYERFGFAKTESAQCSYDPGNQHFRAMRWTEADEAFDIGYSASFKDAEAAMDD